MREAVIGSDAANLGGGGMSRVRRLLIAGILMVVTTSAGAEPIRLPRISPYGLDGFRLMLQQRGLRSTQMEVGTALDSPRETVAIFLGDIRAASKISGQLNDFVDRGGALLVASDLLTSRPRKSPFGGAWFAPTAPLRHWERDRLGFRGFADCPIISAVDREAAPILFDGIKSIVANKPGEIDADHRTTEIAWLPSRQHPPLMVMRQGQVGRLLLIADHSIFINEMMIHCDNARFASNVTKWLCASGSRERLVLVSDGKVLPDWSFGETPPPIPLDQLMRAVQRLGIEDLPIGDSLLPAINDSVHRFQRDNSFNAMLRAAANDAFGSPPLRSAAIVLATLIGCQLVIKWMRRSIPRWRSYQDWNMPSEARLAAAARDKQYYPYLRALAREFFMESGRSDWEGQPTVHESILHVASTAKVRRLWKLATGPENIKMSRSTFQREMSSLRALRQLQIEGNLRIEWPGPLDRS